MKRMMGVALCLVLLAAAALGGTWWHRERQTVQGAQEKLYLQWEKYLSFRNRMDGIGLWAYGYAQRYLEDPSWDNLIRARAAASAARRALKQIEAPQVELDSEVRAALKGRLEEMVMVTDNITAASLELQTMDMQMDNLEQSLQDFFLYTLDTARLKIETEFFRADCEHKNAYYGYITNALLLRFHMKPRWETLQQDCPVLAQFWQPWEASDKRLQARAEDEINQAEQLMQEKQKQLLYAEESLANMEQAVNTGNWALLLEQMEQPAGMPVCFPLPPWDQERTIHYAQREGELIHLVSCGDDLEQRPDLAYIYYAHVSREEFEAYCSMLEGLGFAFVQKDMEDGGAMALAKQGEYSLAVLFSEEETVLRTGEPMASMLSQLDYSLLMQ